MHCKSSWTVCFSLVLLGVAVSSSRASRVSREASPIADPAAQPVADPIGEANLASLGGLSAIAGTAAEGGAEGATDPNAPGTPNACDNGDLLTNLLVYQYLTGSLPSGQRGESNPQLQAFLASQQHQDAITTTSISTSLTTSTMSVDPSTVYSTSTTSYVTTLTSISTSVVPVIFRGSKVTTTLSETNTEVITATEYFTTSSVEIRTIVQTLPVHHTFTQTKTRGRNGRYTVADIVPGPTEVIPQPITTTFDLDSAGLDLSNLDLSGFDLSGVPGIGGADDQVLSALSSLLSQYDNNGPPGPPGGGFGFSRDGGRRGGGGGGGGGSRFSSPDYTDFGFGDSHDPYVDGAGDEYREDPKFNVLSGFTLSDRLASFSGGSGAGRASSDTRYSKFHRKDRVENNGITAEEASAREGERFSASTRRRTVSRAGTRSNERRRNRPQSNRFVPPPETQYFEENSGAPKNFRPFGPRQDREISTSVSSSSSRPSGRRSNRHDRRGPSVKRNNPSSRPAEQRPGPPEEVRTTILTMYLSGSTPDEYSTTYRTVTLRNFATRARRDVEATRVPWLVNDQRSVKAQVLPDLTKHAIHPEKVVKMLKKLDRSKVKNMLKTLNKWVKYYEKQLDVEDEEEEEDYEDEEDEDIVDVPHLVSSIGFPYEIATDILPSETNALPRIPTVTSAIPVVLEKFPMCPAPPTVTSTVYSTIFLRPGDSDRPSPP